MILAMWGVAGLIAAVVLTPLCRALAHRLGAVATPTGDRWHQSPVALLGGVALFGAVMGTAVWLPDLSLPMWSVLAGGTVLFGVGLADDFHPLRPQTKLIVQVLVAVALIGAGLQINATFYPLINILITLMWFVGITNAFNLLDNMDGLATGVAVITVGFRVAFFLTDGNVNEAALALIFLGALSGFLLFNFSPASIFLGDAGSLFIGFSVAGLSLIGGWPYSRGIASVLLFPVLILLVPIFDTAFVTVTRRLANRPISRGGRDHTSHRLVALGLSERRAVVLLYAVAFLAGLLAFLGYGDGLPYAVVLVAFLVIGLALLGIYLSRVRVYQEGEPAADTLGGLVRLIRGFSYSRQVATVMLDLALIVLAYYSAYLLRFEETLAAEELLFLASLPIVIACQLSGLAIYRVYQGVWRYTGLSDLVRLTQAVSLGTVASVLAIVYLYRFEGYSRAIFVLDWVLLIVLVSGSRLSFRLIGELLRGKPEGFRRVLIYGAGDGGVLALREILNNPALARTPTGFLDDDPTKQRSKIHGVSVLGGLDRLEEAIRQSEAQEVIVASTKIPDDRYERLLAVCQSLQVTVVRARLRFE